MKSEDKVVVSSDQKLHIAMFPWLAFGHMLPYLELAKLIAAKGHRVSFLSTPRNIRRLPLLPPHLTPLVTFVPLPLSRPSLNLPENAEATIDLPHDKVKYLKQAFDALQGPVTDFLRTHSPDWLLHDFTPYWIGPIVAQLRIRTAFLSVFIAAQLSFMPPTSDRLSPVVDDRTAPEHFTVPAKWIPFPTTVAPRLYEIVRVSGNMTDDDASVSDTVRVAGVLRSCDILAVRSSAEFEPEWLKLLESLHGKPAIPVGQLPSTPAEPADGGHWRWIKEWLDGHGKGSVVYVAFGSEVKPSQEELTGLARGLELSGLPFFWALRTRRGADDPDEVRLPEGWEERIRGRGVVFTDWAPQFKILSHESVGGVLCHAGWSSVVEAMQLERPLILFPFLFDQGMNARYLEEKKMGYAIPRDDLDGSFTSESVADSLRLVMAGEEGKMYRDKAKEMGGLFGDCVRQDRYVDDFLGYLCNNRCSMGPPRGTSSNCIVAQKLPTEL